MQKSIRISDELYSLARIHAGNECRSIPGQIEFWATLGKKLLDNPGSCVNSIAKSINMNFRMECF